MPTLRLVAVSILLGCASSLAPGPVRAQPFTLFRVRTSAGIIGGEVLFSSSERTLGIAAGAGLAGFGTRVLISTQQAVPLGGAAARRRYLAAGALVSAWNFGAITAPAAITAEAGVLVRSGGRRVRVADLAVGASTCSICTSTRRET